MAAELTAALEHTGLELVLDFDGVQGVTPSFLDETFSIIDEFVADSDSELQRITIENPPTHLSLKFAAVGRGHGLTIDDVDGKWVISKPGDSEDAQ